MSILSQRGYVQVLRGNGRMIRLQRRRGVLRALVAFPEALVTMLTLGYVQPWWQARVSETTIRRVVAMRKAEVKA